MAKYLVLMFLSISFMLSQCRKYKGSNHYQGRIVGGLNAPEMQFPYQASLRYFGQGQHICGGSIIHEEWILTAAHCIDGAPPSTLKVVVGSTELSSGGSSYDVKEAYAHKDYDSYYVKNDIALLKVTPIFYTNQVGRILLGNNNIEGEEPCILTGWGMKEYPGPVSDSLQYITLATTSFDYCNKTNYPVDESQICTLTKAGEGACRYDSGSPLVSTADDITTQIGIMSWIIYCAKGYPDVFTRISFYYNWINETCGCIQ